MNNTTTSDLLCNDVKLKKINYAKPVVNISNWNKLSNVQNHKYELFFDKLEYKLNFF